VHKPPVADVLIEGSNIVAVGPDLAADGVEEIIDARDRLVVPGLINAHYHSHDTLCRGMFEGLPPRPGLWGGRSSGPSVSLIARLLRTLAFHRLEFEFASGMHRLNAVQVRKPTDDGVDVIRINLDPEAASPCSFGSNDGRAATGKRIENNVAAFGAIENCVSYEGCGLDRWMHGKLGIPILSKAIHSWV
jgi:hypothetical protein